MKVNKRVKISASKEEKYLLRGIAMGYLRKNYGRMFWQNVDIENVSKMPLGNSFRVYMFRSGGEQFAIQVNLNKKTIDHLGPYSKNRGFSGKEIIDFNLAKQNGKT